MHVHNVENFFAKQINFKFRRIWNLKFNIRNEKYLKQVSIKSVLDFIVGLLLVLGFSFLIKDQNH